MKGGSWRKIDKDPRGVSNAVSHSTSLAFHRIGKSVLESSKNNNNTEQMDVDEALTVHFEEGIIMNILSRLSMKHFKRAKNDQNSQKSLITHMCMNENRFSSYCCPLSSVQMGENAQKIELLFSWIALFTIEDSSVYRVILKYGFADGELLFSCFHIPSSGTQFRTSSRPFVSWLQPGSFYRKLDLSEISSFLCMIDGPPKNAQTGSASHHPKQIMYREDVGKFNSQQKKKKSRRSFQICKGKSIMESSNNNTEQMDVDQVSFDGVDYLQLSLGIPVALTVHFEEGLVMNILSRLSMRHFKHVKNDQTSQKFLITHLCSNEHRFNSYCCPISLVQMVEDAQKLDRPLSSKPFFRVWCGCDGLVVVLVSGIVVDKHPIHLLWNPSIRESWSALCTIQDISFYRVIPKYRFAGGELLLLSCVHEPGCGIVLRTSAGPFASWMQASIDQDIVVFTESLISLKSLVSNV
ncbi:hypothetical protein H5410_054446 [Solanum commersonii]|uniref:Uncharacterized protein n=1 Tax=Solanum commersonii TaxID=4109 RepID=A0A9J5WH70_SOLCO|nr:hypothetical protein H5410_054446 [Solanum commersonii]